MKAKQGTHNSASPFRLDVVIYQIQTDSLSARYTEKGYGGKCGRNCSVCGRDLHNFPVYFHNRCMRCVDFNVMANSAIRESL